MILELYSEMKIIWANKSAMNINKNAVGITCYEAFTGRNGMCEGCYCAKAFQSGNIETGIVCQANSKTMGESYWEKLEVYVQQHSDAQFSHSICRECAEKYYPDFDICSDV